MYSVGIFRLSLTVQKLFYVFKFFYVFIWLEIRVQAQQLGVLGDFEPFNVIW